MDKLGPQRGSPEGVSGCLHHIRIQSLIPREVCVLKTEKSEQTLVRGKHRLLLGDFGLSWLEPCQDSDWPFSGTFSHSLSLSFAPFHFIKTNQVLTPKLRLEKFRTRPGPIRRGFIWSRSLFLPLNRPSTFLRGSVTLLSAEPQVLISDQCLPPLIVL